MTDGNILDLRTPAQDPLNELLKHGAQQLLSRAAGRASGAVFRPSGRGQRNRRAQRPSAGTDGADRAWRLTRQGAQSAVSTPI